MGLLSRRRKAGNGEAEQAAAATEQEGPLPHEELLAYLESRSDEELQLELANYDNERLDLIAQAAGRYAESPAETLRLGQLTNLGITLSVAYERDEEWFGEFAALLPEDADWVSSDGATDIRTTMDIEYKWAPSVKYIDRFLVNNADATVEDLERMIGLMPIPDDLGREAYIPAVCHREKMDVAGVGRFIERIGSVEQRDHARMTAIKLMTSKSAEVGIARIQPLLDSIEKKDHLREAKISAAKHFATNRSESPEAIAAFVRGIDRKAEREEAMARVAERYVFGSKRVVQSHNAQGVQLLVAFIDTFPEQARPGIRERLCESLAGSKDNSYRNSRGYNSSSRINESDLRELLVPRTELTSLLEKVGA